MTPACPRDVTAWHWRMKNLLFKYETFQFNSKEKNVRAYRSKLFNTWKKRKVAWIRYFHREVVDSFLWTVTRNQHRYSCCILLFYQAYHDINILYYPLLWTSFFWKWYDLKFRFSLRKKFPNGRLQDLQEWLWQNYAWNAKIKIDTWNAHCSTHLPCFSNTG